MKLRIGMLAVLLCLSASAGRALQVQEVRDITTMSIVNEDRIPHSINLDANNMTIQVFADAGGPITLPPGQDVAQRVHRGNWRIIGDNGQLNIRVHHGRDYKLHLRPYRHGDVRTIVGIIEDGYTSQSVPLVNMRRHGHMNDYPDNYYDPRYHNPTPPPGTPSYPYGPVDTHQSLGQVIHQAFDNFLENVADQNNNHPYYVPQQSNPWQ